MSTQSKWLWAAGILTAGAGGLFKVRTAMATGGRSASRASRSAGLPEASSRAVGLEIGGLSPLCTPR